MRDDLNKLLCEHERYGSNRSFRQVRRKREFVGNPGDEYENLRSREGIKRRYIGGWGSDSKEFGENLNPLYGAVRKAVGRRWDDFYSELRTNFDTRSVINQHILQHLYSYIDTKTFLDEDGDVAVHSNYSGVVKVRNSGTDLYVDPRDGIIKRNKHYRSYKQVEAARKVEREREQAKVYREIDENTVLRLIDGVWYEFEMKVIPQGEIRYTKPYAFTEVNVNPTWLRSFPPKMKTWDELNEAERARFGSPKVVGNTAYDVFRHETVVNTSLGLHSAGGRRLRLDDYNKKKYHASKKTASSKTLRQLGIRYETAK